MKKLTLTQDAYAVAEEFGDEEVVHYEATAVDENAEIYTIRWQPLSDETPLDEGDACDWSEYIVTKDGRCVGNETSYALYTAQGHRL